MRIGSVTSTPALRGASRAGALSAVSPVHGISPDYVDENPLDELTSSDRAFLAHLYGPSVDLERLVGTTVGQLATEIARDRARGAVSGGRDLTAEDLRRIVGRLTTTSRPVPVDVQARLMARLSVPETGGRLDVVL
ncbi:hypothetical protein [Kineococcus rubinsiae]|uniref:hypothetical protein n=1 Tax=Kineococcus rubinsiae TaxID=2609562 RepID=UPI0014320222|nr:hypothetical protein [Kineococcus rubinsiae]NIZ89433.1 hypothetical protein [Kineococcus rubinsiae]